MPSNRRKDDFACFVCDYWGALLAVSLIACALLTYKVWYPRLSGQSDAAQATPGPIVVTSLEAERTPGPDLPTATVDQTGASEATGTPETDEKIGDWLTFTDSRLGYTVVYPSAWYATPQDARIAEMQDSVLFSDAPGNNSPQTRTEDERARVWVASYQRGGASQAQWIVNHFNWIAGELGHATVAGLPAETASFSPVDDPTRTQQMTWIDRGDTTLLVWAQYQKDSPEAEAAVKHILATLNFASQ